jgi:hypothetical protein
VAVATFEVQIQPDTIDSPPFLADIPPLTGTVDTPLTFSLEAIDVEGQPSFFLDQNTLAANGLSAPVLAPADLVYSVDFDTGVVTLTPRNGLAGTHPFTVATGVSPAAIDYQVVTVTLEP